MLKLKSFLPHLTLIFALTFLATLAVRAGFGGETQVASLSAEAFPRITMQLEGGDLGSVSGKHFQINENSQINYGPLVYLPPKAPSNLIDLFLILDHSGNTQENSEALRMNLEALVKNMQQGGIDVKIYLTTFKSPDSPVDQALTEFNEAEALSVYLEELDFDASPLLHAFGLNKLYYLSTIPARAGAEKVALVLNGSSFYTHETYPNQTTYTVADTVNQLAAKNFIVFVLGAPFKSLHALKSQQVEDASLSHSLAGGYLGAFASDLNIVQTLLQSRSINQAVLMYYSNLNLDQTGPVELYIQGELVSSFQYPALDRSAPGYVTYLNNNPVKWGDPVTLQVRVNPIHRLLGLVELYSLDALGQVKRHLLKPEMAQNNAEGLYYQLQIQPYDHPQEFFRYAVVAHTPFGPIGSMSDMISLPVLQYEEGINLQPMVSEDSILWKWSGPMVDQGNLYQLWLGEEMMAETAQKQFSIPAEDCSSYQLAKVRVKVAGEWSHFSAIAEAYSGPEGSISEQEGIELLLNCIKDPALQSVAEVVQGFNSYDSGKDLYLEKTLYYFTRILNPQMAEEVDFGRYRLFFMILQWISVAEYEQYDLAVDEIPSSLLYKLVAQANHAKDLEALLDWALNELELRLQGHPTI